MLQQEESLEIKDYGSPEGPLGRSKMSQNGRKILAWRFTYGGGGPCCGFLWVLAGCWVIGVSHPSVPASHIPESLASV